eukprot:43881_1
MSNQSNKTILSPVCRDLDLSDWRDIVLLNAHEPIRHALSTLISITEKQYYKTSNIKILKKKIKKCLKWYQKYFCLLVHCHHDGEEKILFPWIEHNCEKLPPKISKQHVELMEMMKEITNMKKSFEKVSNEKEFDAELNKLNDLCQKLKQDMSEHLNEEERCIASLFKKYQITQNQYNEVHKRVLQEGRKLGFSAHKRLVPWLIDIQTLYKSQAQMDKVMKQVPGLMKPIIKYYWMPHYLKNNKNIAQKIQNCNLHL